MKYNAHQEIKIEQQMPFWYYQKLIIKRIHMVSITKFKIFEKWALFDQCDYLVSLIIKLYTQGITSYILIWMIDLV